MLRLRIVSDHRASMGGNAEKTLQGDGLTVGRGTENGWILPDPDLLLSRQHCVFEKAGAQFRVIDTSTNGVFLNGSDRPLGRNQSAVLSSGDRVRLGRFVIEATIESQAAPSFTEIAGAFPFGNKGASSPDPFAPPLDRSAARFDDDGFGLGGGPALRPFEHQPLRSEDGGFDAWTASNSGDSFRGAAGRDDWRFGTVDDHADAMNQALPIAPARPPFPPPLDHAGAKAAGGIPDDWDDELFDAPATPAPAAVPLLTPTAQPLPEDWNIDATLPEHSAEAAWPPADPVAAPAFRAPDPAPGPIPPLPLSDESVIVPIASPARPPAAPQTPLAAPAAPLQPAVATTPTPDPVPARAGTGDDSAVALAAFYQGLGVAVPAEGVPDAVAMMRSLGEALRVSLGALHASLQARSHFKDEFHLEQTSFRPAGENPLKRCATLDEAMSVLANPRLRGFLPMSDAVREAASDVQVHHLAYAAALQTALKQVVAKFDPGALSQRLETRLLDSLLASARKARYWDQYEALYKDLVVELEEDFDRVVGDAIAREYDRFVRGGNAASD